MLIDWHPNELNRSAIVWGRWEAKMEAASFIEGSFTTFTIFVFRTNQEILRASRRVSTQITLIRLNRMPSTLPQIGSSKNGLSWINIQRALDRALRIWTQQDILLYLTVDFHAIFLSLTCSTRRSRPLFVYSDLASLNLRDDFPTTWGDVICVQISPNKRKRK